MPSSPFVSRRPIAGLVSSRSPRRHRLPHRTTNEAPTHARPQVTARRQASGPHVVRRRDMTRTHSLGSTTPPTRRPRRACADPDPAPHPSVTAARGRRVHDSTAVAVRTTRLPLVSSRSPSLSHPTTTRHRRASGGAAAPVPRRPTQPHLPVRPSVFGQNPPQTRYKSRAFAVPALAGGGSSSSSS